MLYYLSLLTHTDQLAFFRLFRYLTFRSGAAVMTALADRLLHQSHADPLAEGASRARASPSAATARSATSSKRPARPPWAAF